MKFLMVLVLAAAPALAQCAVKFDPLLRKLTCSPSSGGGALTFTVDGGGAVPSAGTVRCTRALSAKTAKTWTILGNTTGSIQLDIWVAAFGSSLPTVANSIVAAAPPSLSNAVTSEASVPITWTAAIPAGSNVCVSVTSASTLTSATLIVGVQ